MVGSEVEVVSLIDVCAEGVEVCVEVWRRGVDWLAGHCMMLGRLVTSQRGRGCSGLMSSQSGQRSLELTCFSLKKKMSNSAAACACLAKVAT